MLFSDKILRVQLFDQEDSLNPCCNGCCSLTNEIESIKLTELS